MMVDHVQHADHADLPARQTASERLLNLRVAALLLAGISYALVTPVSDIGRGARIVPWMPFILAGMAR